MFDFTENTIAEKEKTHRNKQSKGAADSSQSKTPRGGHAHGQKERGLLDKLKKIAQQVSLAKDTKQQRKKTDEEEKKGDKEEGTF